MYDMTLWFIDKQLLDFVSCKYLYKFREKQ